jgi:hypothetical protein
VVPGISGVIEPERLSLSDLRLGYMPILTPQLHGPKHGKPVDSPEFWWRIAVSAALVLGGGHFAG